MSVHLRLPLSLCVLIGLAPLTLTLAASAAPPSCVRGGELLICADGLGNRYGVRNDGIDTYTRGYPDSLGRSWAQTNTRYGTLTIFSGVGSDGEVWLGRIQKVGWTSFSRFSNSRGESQRLRCNAMTGCTPLPAPE